MPSFSEYRRVPFPCGVYPPVRDAMERTRAASPHLIASASQIADRAAEHFLANVDVRGKILQTTAEYYQMAAQHSKSRMKANYSLQQKFYDAIERHYHAHYRHYGSRARVMENALLLYLHYIDAITGQPLVTAIAPCENETHECAT